MPALGLYDTEITGPLIAAIRAGQFQKTACQIAGISFRQYKRWMAEGRDGKSPYHRQFYKDVKKAQALAEAERVEAIRKAQDNNWQAAAWYLERSRWQRWGKRDRSEMVVTHERPKSVQHVVQQIRQALAMTPADSIEEPPPELNGHTNGHINGHVSAETPEPPELPEDSYHG